MIIEIVGSMSILAGYLQQVPCFWLLFTVDSQKVFWIEGNTFSDFDFFNAQAISSDLCDFYLHVGHKSIFHASNLLNPATKRLQGRGNFPHQRLVDIDSSGGGLEIFEQFAINLNSEQFIL